MNSSRSYMDMFCKHKDLLRLAALLLCIGLIATAAWAQSTTDGAIGGTVADPQNAVVPGATVTITHVATNMVQTATTNETGGFRVGSLPPGTYTITVNAQGFAPYKMENVIVAVGTLTPVNPHLTIGTTEHVEVSGEAPMINVTSSEIAPTLNEKAIQNLPINGGRWSSFAMLTPGVTADASGFGLVSVRGMSPLLNTVTVDGADNNQAYFSEERGRTRAGYSTPKTSIQEFQVNTSNYSAEYGRSAGGVINSVTKSGTNQIHGDAYIYDRDNAWGSMNAWTKLTSAVYGNGADHPPTGSVTNPYKPKDVRIIGGASVGGAIIKDKLFWFLTVDRFHRNFPGTAVPSNAGLFFEMPSASGVTCSTVRSGTANQNVCQLASLLVNRNTTGTVTAAQYTDAYNKYVAGLFGNPSTGQLGLLSVTGPVPRTGDQSIVLPKLDWTINSKNHASLTVNRMRWWSPAGIQTQATNNYGASTFGNDYVSVTWGVAKLDTQLTSNLTNQFRVQYGRDFEWETNQNPLPYDTQTFINRVAPGTTSPVTYTNPYGVAPNIYISNSFQWGSTLYGNRYVFPSEYKTQIADTISWQHGKHTVKFGGDWIKNDDTIQNLYQQYAEFSYSGLPQYFADLYNPYTNCPQPPGNVPTQCYHYYSNFYQAFQGTSIATPVQKYQFATNDYGFFVQDDWRIARRLTLNFGFRYDTERMPGPFPNLQNTIALGSQSALAGVPPKSPNNFSPRVGFAWDMFGDSKTVLRGGYGMYSGRILNVSLYSAMTTTGAVTSSGMNSYTIKNTNTLPCAPNFPRILTDSSACATSSNLTYFDPNFKAPQIHEVDLTLQRQLGWNTTLSINYMGSFGRHLQSFLDANIAAPGTPYCAYASGTNLGLQAPTTPVNGACSSVVVSGTTYSTTYRSAPPTTITYNNLTNTLNGAEVVGSPLPTTYQVTGPYFTSRLNPGLNSVTNVTSGVNSSYNAMVVQLEHRFANHVQFGATYTWSHTLDQGVNGTTNYTGGNNSFDPIHPGWGVYGNSNYNIPQRFTLHSVVEAPWKHSGVLAYLVDGWQASPVLQIQKGFGNSMAVYYPSGGIVVYDGTTKYVSPAGGMLGAGGPSQMLGTTRNGYLQPSTYIVDLRLSKNFKLSERFKLEFSADSFNLLNHQNVTGVSGLTAYQINNPAAGVAGTATYPTLSPNNSTSSIANGVSLFNTPSNSNSNFTNTTRQIQLGLRLSF